MFVTRTAYDALQRECERERERRSQEAIEFAKRYDQSVQFLQERNTWWAERYDQERKTNRALLKLLVALKKEGFAPSRTEQQQHVSTPQSDVDLVYNTQRQLARDAAYQDLLAQGLSPDEARGEAARMIDSLFAPVAGEFQ